METCFNYCDREAAFFSSDELKWINRVRKLAAEFPDQVTILREPENNDGCIYAKLPVEWMKIQQKRRVTYTDEQIAMMTERLKFARKTPSCTGETKQTENGGEYADSEGNPAGGP